MTATRLVITGTWVTETDTPASGRIQFQANDVGFVNGGELVRAGVQGYALDKTGSINVSLIRCPDGYTVTEQINGAYKRSYILPDQVGPVDLRSVVVPPVGIDPVALIAAEATARQQGDIAEQDARESEFAGLSTIFAPIAEVAARISGDAASVKRTGGGKEAVVTIDPAGSAATLDLSLGNVFVVKNPVAGGTCTLTITGATAGVACGCNVIFYQRSSANSGLAFAGTVIPMNDGAVPGPAQAANTISEYSLRTLDGGTTWQVWKVGDSATAAPAATAGLTSTFSYVYANNGLTKVVPANTFTNFLEIVDFLDTPGTPLLDFDFVNHRYHVLKDCLVQLYGDLFWPDISSDPAASVYFRMNASDGHLWSAFVRSWAYESLPQFGYRFQTPIFKFAAGTTLKLEIYKSSAGMTVNYAEVWATAFAGA